MTGCCTIFPIVGIKFESFLTYNNNKMRNTDVNKFTYVYILMWLVSHIFELILSFCHQVDTFCEPAQFEEDFERIVLSISQFCYNQS